MLIIGAGGLAAQLFDELIITEKDNIVFWSETDTPYTFIKDKFEIIKTDDEVVQYFNTVSRSFILCIGCIDNRKRMAEKFERLGGEIISYVSPFALISPYISLGLGTLILARTEIEPGVTIGEKCLINKYGKIGHGCIIGANCEFSPDVIITGEVKIGEGTYIGTRAIILPKVQIGRNVIIAAGAIVKKNVPDNAVVSGEFATIKFFQK